jgi:tight adherence protein C
MSMETVFIGIVGIMLCAGLGLLAYGVADMLAQRRQLLLRLGGRVPTADAATAHPEPLLMEDPHASALSRFLRPGEESNLSRMRRRLRRAGYRGASAVRLYYTYKWTIAFGGVLLASLFIPRLLVNAGQWLSIAAFVLVFLVCLFAADLWVDRRIAWRRNQIDLGLPDALDLLLVCLEAGHGLDQAFVRVAREIGPSNPTLSEELSLFVAELAVGKPRAEALSDLADRCGVSGVVSLTTVIKQADKFGVSIADTLRVYAREMRDRRFVKAEERANMMPVKLAITLVLLTIYPLLLIVIGPAFIKVVRALS